MKLTKIPDLCNWVSIGKGNKPVTQQTVVLTPKAIPVKMYVLLKDPLTLTQPRRTKNSNKLVITQIIERKISKKSSVVIFTETLAQVTQSCGFPHC